MTSVPYLGISKGVSFGGGNEFHLTVVVGNNMASMVQYIVVRSDLTKTLKWPLGALVAQACHACSAVMFLFRDDPNVKEYTSNLDSMHKVVLEVMCSG